MENFKLPIKVENVTISSEVYEALCINAIQSKEINANLLKFLEKLQHRGVILEGKDDVFVEGFDDLHVQSTGMGFIINVR
jgi:hypothetical protein